MFGRLMIAISIKVVLGLSHVESPRCEGVVAVAFGGTTVGLLKWNLVVPFQSGK